MLTIKLLKKIFQSKPDVDAEYVYNSLKEIEKITQGIRNLNREKEAECKAHDEKLKEIDRRIRDFQKTCTHWSTTYYPDASGNNDSFYSCDICDETL